MTSLSLSTTPPEHPVTRFIVLANSKSARLLFTNKYKSKRRKCSLGNKRGPQIRDRQKRKCWMIVSLVPHLLMRKCWCQVWVCVCRCEVVWLRQDITSISIWAWIIINWGADVRFFWGRRLGKGEWEKMGWISLIIDLCDRMASYFFPQGCSMLSLAQQHNWEVGEKTPRKMFPLHWKTVQGEFPYRNEPGCNCGCATKFSFPSRICSLSAREVLSVTLNRPHSCWKSWHNFLGTSRPSKMCWSSFKCIIPTQ